MLLRKQMKEMRDAKEVNLNLGMGAEVCQTSQDQAGWWCKKERAGVGQGECDQGFRSIISNENIAFKLKCAVSLKYTPHFKIQYEKRMQNILIL